ncbi:helix-turn-helix domain-containing protein [Ancylobacter terrae]|uniref:helix-turn-helix domain-containing protein n=1 Tax=Ancylobacter sp. sgz301288 TaxID=3342077 RepID=UPI00385BC156
MRQSPCRTAAWPAGHGESGAYRCFARRRTADWAPPARACRRGPELLAGVCHQPSLIYFNAVAEHLLVHEAARRLNAACSAMTRQVVQLERALGIAYAIATRAGPVRARARLTVTLLKSHSKPKKGKVSPRLYSPKRLR